MWVIFVFYQILVIFGAIECSIIDPSFRFKILSDDGDPGEALYLTEYIENDDIETVRTNTFKQINIAKVLFKYLINLSQLNK